MEAVKSSAMLVKICINFEFKYKFKINYIFFNKIKKN